MDDLNSYVKHVTRFTLVFMSICLLVWALFPSIRIYAAGLILGTAVSLLNTRYLSVKIMQMSELVIQRERKRFNLGFLTRAAIALLTVMLALKWDQVDLVSTIAGLIFTQLATILVGIFLLSKNPKA